MAQVSAGDVQALKARVGSQAAANLARQVVDDQDFIAPFFQCSDEVVTMNPAPPMTTTRDPGPVYALSTGRGMRVIDIKLYRWMVLDGRLVPPGSRRTSGCASR
jgi:hypothetical protein